MFATLEDITVTTSAGTTTNLSALRADLVQACRVLYAEGLAVGPIGHVSARIAGTDQMLIKPVMIGFEEMNEDDFLLMDFAGNKLSGGGTVGQVPAEFHIHTEIYRARPELQSVVHTHPAYTVALSASGQTPGAYSIESRQFAAGIPMYDETTDVITTPELGRGLVRAMGMSLSVVMKHHGVAVGGSTIPDACLRNVALEQAAKMHLLARQFGTPAPLSPAETSVLSSPEVVRVRAKPTWDYYCRRAERLLAGGM